MPKQSETSPESRAPRMLPAWVWIAPFAALVLLAIKYSGLLPFAPALLLIPAALLLGATIFASVHLAEVIALRVGEPMGSIVLSIAVTVIEVALIVSTMLSAKVGADVLARDTVFATVMIVLNGIVGLCLILGGARHHEQSFQPEAAAAALSVIGTLAVLALVLPNYTTAVPGPFYSSSQLIFVGVASTVLYGVFLFVQTIRHRDYFINLAEAAERASTSHDHSTLPSARVASLSLFLLCSALVAVVLLAKLLAPSLENAIAAASLPKAFTGVVIAAIVLLPEGTAAVLAAHNNRLQTSLNLALGSAMATIGLTIPIVGLVAIMFGQPLTLGLKPTETALLLLTLFISTVTLATGRTTILQGAVHFVIFAVLLLLAAVP